MKLSSSLLIASCIAHVLTFPTVSTPGTFIAPRGVLEAADDLENGNKCRDAYLVFAKGSLSLEFGNLVD